MNFLFSSIQIAKARWLKAGVAAVLLCSFAICIAVVPVYKTPSKDRTRPFPCQDTPCGCSDAETCWRDCCCNTHAQKLAWAKKNGVTPPAYVFELAREEIAEAKKATPVRACCQKSQARACCSSKSAGACCNKKVASKKEDDAGGWVTWIGRQKCRGQSLSWLMVGHGISLCPAPAIVPLEGLSQAVCERVSQLQSVKMAPDAPPPRVSLA